MPRPKGSKNKEKPWENQRHVYVVIDLWSENPRVFETLKDALIHVSQLDADPDGMLDAHICKRFM